MWFCDIVFSAAERADHQGPTHPVAEWGPNKTVKMLFGPLSSIPLQHGRFSNGDICWLYTWMIRSFMAVVGRQ
jgi:hypothetical protein